MHVTALCLTVLASASAHAQVAPGAGAAADLRSGRGYIATPVFSEEDDRMLLALFDGLRVADVTDGMDAVGLAQAEDVARYARKIIEDDKEGRRELYRKLGLPPDPSIR